MSTRRTDRNQPSSSSIANGASINGASSPNVAASAIASGPVSGFDSTKLLIGDSKLPGRSLGFAQGFKQSHPAENESTITQYDGDAHLITVAPTRSGKGTGVIIPNMLNYEGPVVCHDPKGEAYMVTSRRRAKFGKVFKIDPFSVVNDETHSLNPLDLCKLPGSNLDSDAQALADLMARGITALREPFWDLSGCGLISGLLAYAAGHEDPAKCNLLEVLDKLSADDVVYNLAVLLDTVGKTMSRMAHREIATFLQMPDITRGGVLATAQSYVKSLIGPQVERTLASSSFSLTDVISGEPMTIYLIIPPDKIHSHRSLLKLWVGTLFNAILRRKHRPQLRTLFLLDEVASLETFPLLESLVTLSAGYGVWAWMIFQDLAQLQTHYKSGWKTILNNCGMIQTFGVYNRDMATQWSGYLDHGPNDLRGLRADEQVVAVHGQGEQRGRRLNYLTDSRFYSMFDENRFYTPEPTKKKRAKRAGEEPTLGGA